MKLNDQVKVTGPLSPTGDTSFLGQIGTITSVYVPDENDVEGGYQVTLPDGRHDLFYADEITNYL